jgi:hypothetical protein
MRSNLSRSSTRWFARVAVALLSFQIPLHLGIASAQTNISFEEFQTSTSELIDQSVRIAGKIKVAPTFCTLIGVLINANAQPGDTFNGNFCGGTARLVGSDEEVNSSDSGVSRQGISLNNISCRGREVLTYLGGGSVENTPFGSYLTGGNIKSEIKFNCRFQEQDVKPGSFYTVTGTVRDKGTGHYIEVSAIEEQVLESEN